MSRLVRCSPTLPSQLRRLAVLVWRLPTAFLEVWAALWAMNAGAYGGEMQQVVESVTALFPDGLRTLRGEALRFGYRHSVFTEEKGVVLAAVLSLQKGTVRQSVPKWTI